MSTQKQISTSIALCCKAILNELDGETDPRKNEILIAQCKKFNHKEDFIKKLIFFNDERIDRRYKRIKIRNREKEKSF